MWNGKRMNRENFRSHIIFPPENAAAVKQPVMQSNIRDVWLHGIRLPAYLRKKTASFHLSFFFPAPIFHLFRLFSLSKLKFFS